MKVTLRKGESAPQPRYRENRFFHSMEKWYYLTREGMVEGPFEDRSEAEQQLDGYLKQVVGNAS